MMTDIAGVLRDKNDPTTLIPALTRVGYKLPGKMDLEYTKKHIVLLAVLFVIGSVIFKRLKIHFADVL